MLLPSWNLGRYIVCPTLKKCAHKLKSARTTYDALCCRLRSSGTRGNSCLERYRGVQQK